MDMWWHLQVCICSAAFGFTSAALSVPLLALQGLCEHLSVPEARQKPFLPQVREGLTLPALQTHELPLTSCEDKHLRSIMIAVLGW